MWLWSQKACLLMRGAALRSVWLGLRRPSAGGCRLVGGARSWRQRAGGRSPHNGARLPAPASRVEGAPTYGVRANELDGGFRPGAHLLQCPPVRRSSEGRPWPMSTSAERAAAALAASPGECPRPAVHFGCYDQNGLKPGRRDKGGTKEVFVMVQVRMIVILEYGESSRDEGRLKLHEEARSTPCGLLGQPVQSFQFASALCWFPPASLTPKAKPKTLLPGS
ncbi:uncharacterized protein LOC116664235 [Camelus ferus]|uniref:Uncharacterized protein LOC116664235 n=1 Tax=Camelus ferus TaxID=419612 RepID=A0A8B8T712_CAMFR|nr:uncharacterized protein LOC116664235 [Camelus ferus]